MTPATVALFVRPPVPGRVKTRLAETIGDLRTQSLLDLYDGEPARRYRAGSAACRDCDLRPVCRGCAAVTHGFGLDVHTALDPYCFRDCLPRS